MAVRQYVKDQAATGGASMGDGSLVRIMWTGLTSATSDTGQPAPYGEWADRTWHIFCTNYLTGVQSTIGGGTISILGSNDYDPVTDASNYTSAILTDQNGNPMTYTAVALKQGTEAPLWAWPAVTAGTGLVATVILVARRIQPMITGG